MNMKDIINIYDRLHIIKQLFELQIKVGDDFGFLHFSTKFQDWSPNYFRAECIEANLNDIKQHKILKDILNLTNEIIDMYGMLPKIDYLNNENVQYRFDCTPSGRYLSNFRLTKKEDGKRYYYHIEDNSWELLPQGCWKEYPINKMSFEERREEWKKEMEKPTKFRTVNNTLIYFVLQINSFLNESVFFQPKPSEKALIYKRISNLPVIDDKKYKTNLIYEHFNNKVFKCSEDCFNAWLVNGHGCHEKIQYILKGRKSRKTGEETLNFAQLRKFIEKITGDSENTKDAYYKNVFGLTIKCSTIKTSNQFKLDKELKECEIVKK